MISSRTTTDLPTSSPDLNRCGRDGVRFEGGWERETSVPHPSTRRMGGEETHPGERGGGPGWTRRRRRVNTSGTIHGTTGWDMHGGSHPSWKKRDGLPSHQYTHLLLTPAKDPHDTHHPKNPMQTELDGKKHFPLSYSTRPTKPKSFSCLDQGHRSKRTGGMDGYHSPSLDRDQIVQTCLGNKRKHGTAIQALRISTMCSVCRHASCMSQGCRCNLAVLLHTNLQSCSISNGLFVPKDETIPMRWAFRPRSLLCDPISWPPPA